MEHLLRKLLERMGVEADRVLGRRWGWLTPVDYVPAVGRVIEAHLNPDAKGVKRVAPGQLIAALSYELHSRLNDAARAELEMEIARAAQQYITDHRYQTPGPLTVQIICDPYLRQPFEIRAEPKPGPAAPPTFVLVSAEGRRIRLKPGEKETEKRWTIGRTGDNDIPIDHPSVSRFHASLTMNAGGELALADLGSANGTFVNGARIAEARRLQPEEEVTFGSVRFRLVQE
jgi:hypothetical protein